jgi:5-methylcytosine-specific restriction endonuclease McrA
MAYTDEEIKWIYDRTDGRCIYCGTRLVFDNYSLLAAQGAWDVNYFIPKLNNGERSRENWVPACITCDTVKGECFPWEYDARRFLQGDENPDNYIEKKDATSHT